MTHSFDERNELHLRFKVGRNKAGVVSELSEADVSATGPLPLALRGERTAPTTRAANVSAAACQSTPMLIVSLACRFR